MNQALPRPQQFDATVIGTEYLTPKILRLDLALLQRGNFAFIPGQFINLKVSETSYRSYSIASARDNKKYFSLIISVGHEGLGSRYVTSLNLGDTVTFIGPSGSFVLPDKIPQEVVFVATGTGIAPILSILYDICDRPDSPTIKLYWGLRDETEIYLMDELTFLKKKYKDFEFHICLSKPSRLWKGRKGRVTDSYAISDSVKSLVLLCGNPNMIIDMQESLQKRGFSSEMVVKEKFINSVAASKK